MSKYIRCFGAPIVIALVTVLAACSSDAKKGPDSVALGADTTLNRDLALANRDTTVQPQLKDVPPNAPAPVATPRQTHREPVRREPVRQAPRHEPSMNPAPLPPIEPATRTTPSGNIATTNPGGSRDPGAAGGGAVGAIPGGTTISTNASSKVCTNTNAIGDHITATVANSVSGSNGAMIPAGATVNLTVTNLHKSANANDKIVMEFAVNSVSFGGRTYPLDATIASADVSRVRDQSQTQDVEKVAGGAILGAIAGHIIGRSTKGTVIGAAAGGAAGAATAAATASYQGCINSGSSIVIRLSSAATVRA